jgi:hypothetical protein
MSEDKLRVREKSLKINAIIINPREDIQKALLQKDWVSGFSYAVRYIENYGQIKIRNFIELHILSKIVDGEQRKRVENQCIEDLKRLRVTDIVLILLILGIIDNSTYMDLRGIITERNKLEHASRKGIGYQFDATREKERQDFLQKAIVHIYAIMEKKVS